MVRRYQDRISGPLLDRIDLQVQVKPVEQKILIENSAKGESSSQVRQRVIAARERQLTRQSCPNASLTGDNLKTLCALQQPQQQLMAHAMNRLNLSARGYHRVLRVARTIADLADSPAIENNHLAEALGYRFNPTH